MARFFRSHRTAAYKSRGRLPVWAMICICVAAAVLLTTLVGNILRWTLDEDTLKKLTEDETPKLPAAQSPSNIYLPNINAYPYTAGDAFDTVIGYPAVTLTLNAPNGAPLYASDVLTYFDPNATPPHALYDTVTGLRGATSYLSGMFYPQASLQPSEDLRYAASAMEGALLKEYFSMGGNDALLMGLDFSPANLDTTLAYVKHIKAAVGASPLGVAIPLSVLQSEGAWEVLARLLETCDFYALDLSKTAIVSVAEGEIQPDGTAAPEALLKSLDYWIRQYPTRLLLKKDQTDMIAYLETVMFQNYQIYQ